MAGYTIVNLKEDVEDSAPKFGHSPEMEARFAREPLELRHSGLSYQRLAPSFRQPFGHRHKEQEEIYLILDGSASLKLDDEVVDLRQWDAIRVEPQIARCFEAGPDGAAILAFDVPGEGPESNDAEQLPGWWSD